MNGDDESRLGSDEERRPRRWRRRVSEAEYMELNGGRIASEATVPTAEAVRVRRQFKAASIGLPVVIGLLLYFVIDRADILASLAFIAGVPTVLTLAGLLYTDEEDLRSYRSRVFLPI